MTGESDNGRDLGPGVPVAAFDATGMVEGHKGDDAILVIRDGAWFHAVSARCTHKGAKLVEGIVAGGTIRCPWHHACFDPRTGAAVAAPAFRALERWSVDERDGIVHVGDKLPPLSARPQAATDRIVIVGGGAAGTAAADALVRMGHGAMTTLIDQESDAAYDRTLLSKAYLSGKAGDDKLPLEMEDLAVRGVDVRRGTAVASIEPEGKHLTMQDGTTLPFDKLILATGAEPKRLDVPGADLPHVHVLRSLADARAIVAAVGDATRVVIAGGSFIGLEAAAAMRDRELSVTVVSPDPAPFADALGPEIAAAIMAKHEERGTAFHLGRQIVRIEATAVVLDDGARVPADLVIVGIGVTPRTALAEQAGLTVEDGVVVDERLRTSHRDIFAVGDIARWPDPHTGRAIRVEHWAVAQRQGQIAAANAAGANLRYDVVPFFWTMHFDYSVRYVGHGSKSDRRRVEGDPAARDAAVFFSAEGRDTATASVERDRATLDAELAMERKRGGPAALLPG